MNTGWDAYEPFRPDFHALDPDRYPADYMDAQVYAGFWRCWGTPEAAILVELKRYPSGVLEVHGVAAAGDLQTIVGLIPCAEHWGRELGAVRAVIESRSGWERILNGYEVHQVSIRKDLA